MVSERWHDQVADDHWRETSRRNARSVQTTVGWIFWDPGAVSRFEARGLPGPLGYIASRGAPLAPAGAEALTAAFGTISSVGIAITFDLLKGDVAAFREFWNLRDEAVDEGLHRYAPGIVDPLVEMGPALWSVVDRLPRLGRVLFGATVSMPRPRNPLLSGWHAVNAIREWRGDSHWALVASAGLTSSEASVLHNEWLGYGGDWLSKSRGQTEKEINDGWELLSRKKLAAGHRLLPSGLRLRQHLEDLTDELAALPWQLLGADLSTEFAERLEPPCELLLARVDETAGPNYQPASRLRERYRGPEEGAGTDAP
ncbi:SCO6745 family protein [Streptomyces sp. MMS24-I31]|uniref:SCO6745 family protein n=1 Tax=Streptomyces sp. MMS24-I31 TaxID=3351563 RepID=UPI003896B909